MHRCIARPLPGVLLAFVLGGPLLLAWSSVIAEALIAAAGGTLHAELPKTFSFGGFLQAPFVGAFFWLMFSLTPPGFVLMCVPTLLAAALYWSATNLLVRHKVVVPRTRLQSVAVCSALGAVAATCALLAVFALALAAVASVLRVPPHEAVAIAAVDGALLGACLGAFARAATDASQETR